MIHPTVHLNGTSRDQLEEQTTAARRAVNAAIKAFAEAYPNGRDYYPQGDGTIGQAMREHDAEAAKLRSVLAWLDARAEYLADERSVYEMHRRR